MQSICQRRVPKRATRIQKRTQRISGRFFAFSSSLLVLRKSYDPARASPLATGSTGRPAVNHLRRTKLPASIRVLLPSHSPAVDSCLEPCTSAKGKGTLSVLQLPEVCNAEFLTTYPDLQGLSLGPGRQIIIVIQSTAPTHLVRTLGTFAVSHEAENHRWGSSHCRSRTDEKPLERHPLSAGRRTKQSNRSFLRMPVASHCRLPASSGAPVANCNFVADGGPA